MIDNKNSSWDWKNDLFLAITLIIGFILGKIL